MLGDVQFSVQHSLKKQDLPRKMANVNTTALVITNAPIMFAREALHSLEKNHTTNLFLTPILIRSLTIGRSRSGDQ